MSSIDTTSTPPPAAAPSGGSPVLERFGAQMEQVGADQRAAFEQNQAALAPRYSALSKTMAQPRPAIPNQRPLPNAPKREDFQQDAMLFASAMAVLGAVAGRFTRTPGEASLKAFAGAVNGWQEGNLEQYNSKVKEWEANTKKTIENNQQVLEKYKLTLANRKANIDEQMSQIQLIAAQYHDKMMYDAAAAKNYTLVADIFQKNWEYTDKAKTAADKLKAKYDEDQKKLEATANYWMSPDGVAKRATLTPEQNAAIDKMISSRATGKSAIAQDRQQFINEYTDEHGVPPTSAQINQWQNERAGSRAEETVVGRRAGNIAIAVQEAHDTVPNVWTAAQKSAGKGLATWNKIENKWKVEKGDENFAYYVQQLNSLINVYGRVISGGGKGTVSDLEHAREMLNPNMPLSAVKGSLRGFTTEIDIAEKAPEKVRARMRGTNTGTTPAETTDAPPPATGGDDHSALSDDELKKKLGLP